MAVNRSVNGLDKRLWICLIALGLALAFFNAAVSRSHKPYRQAAALNQSCALHTPRASIFSTDPLIVYLEDFITEDEAQHLLATSSPTFKESQRVDIENGVAGGVDKEFRSSQTAFLTSDPITKCIEQRALRLQGHLTAPKVETLQVVKYGPTDHVNNHYDWFHEATVSKLQLSGKRDTTIFGYIHANCTGGGTNFPRIRVPMSMSSKWCQYVDCELSAEIGLTFRAISRNAVFWQNWSVDGYPRQDLLHNGQPILNGTKIGLNLWTSSTYG